MEGNWRWRKRKGRVPLCETSQQVIYDIEWALSIQKQHAKVSCSTHQSVQMEEIFPRVKSDEKQYMHSGIKIESYSKCI